VSTLRRKDGTSAETQGPARGYSWPPFEKGNTAAARHGAFSDRMIEERAAEIRAYLLGSFPYLAEDTFAEAMIRYCRAEARARMLHEYVMGLAERDGVEAVRPYLWTETSRAESNAQKFAQDLGLDPMGHARIARELGWAKQLAAGRAAAGVEKLRRLGTELRLLPGEDNTPS
jgi:hypothetical protein